MRARIRLTAKNPVIAALLFQSVTLLVGVASVPLLLFFLSSDDFLAWILIATFGALTLQVEQGILTVGTRNLARCWHSGDRPAFLLELSHVRRNFRRLSAAVVIGLGGFGLVYFGFLADLKLSPTWPVAWVIFIAGYGLNYLFGHNSAILLATECTVQFNLVNAVTRAVNFMLTAFLLWNGLAILGLTLSFLISVSLTVSLQRWRAQRQLATLSQLAGTNPSVTAEAALSQRPTLVYSAYVMSNFFLYKGAFLIMPVLPGADHIADYGLGLQLVAIIYAVSIIPTQVWLGQLVKAFLAKDVTEVRRNLLISLTFATLVFLLSFLAMILLANPALHFIGSEVVLPSNRSVGLLFIGFLVEAYIFVQVNLLLVAREVRFLRVYIGAVATILAGCSLGQILFPDIGVTTIFLVVPLVVQSLVTLPVATSQVAKLRRRLSDPPRSPGCGLA